MKKVLIITHEKSIHNGTSEYLENSGFDVIHSQNGPMGVQKALEYSPDIILCDSETKGFNGYEVFNTLQQINSTATIPFVLLTTNASYNNIRTVMDLGVDDYIVKPLDNKVILKLINTRIDKQDKIINIADEKFNYLMENSVSGIYIYQDEQLKYINKKFCQILGYTQKELFGINLVNLIFKDDLQIVVEKISKCITGIQKNLLVQFKVICKNQEIVKIKLLGNVIKIRNKKSLIGSIEEIKNNKPNGLEYITNPNIHLTKREIEILLLICTGLSNNEISKKLYISERTVDSHRAHLLSKTNSKNSVRLSVFAIKHGIYKI
ncbi:MAG: response regulator [Bacteroidales bacterium]|jgi:PAS domain S-box-containing protein|nr:response regulator [Bacteroidales bacterium]